MSRAALVAPEHRAETEAQFVTLTGLLRLNVIEAVAPMSVILTVDGVLSEGALRCLAGHINNGASRSPGLHTTSH